MTQWTFIVGFCDQEIDPVTKKVTKTAEQSYQGLQDAIQKFYTDRLPKGAPFFTSRWNQDVLSEILTRYPTGDLGIIGFSFGGQKAVEVCQALALLPTYRAVKKLVLIEPVDFNNPKKPNTSGFAIPRNVVNARCFHRKNPTAIPWSGGITSPVIIDTTYISTTSDPHGEYVWKADTINEVKAAT